MKLITPLLTIWVLFHCINCCAQSKKIHLSWNNNKKNATESTMSFTWVSSQADEQLIKYGMNRDLNDSRTSVSARSTEVNGYVNKVTLNKLSPNTSYFYKCGNDRNGWSEMYSFKTAPKIGSKDKFVVGVWGDTQDDTDSKTNFQNPRFVATAEIVKQFQKHPMDFTIHMGDNVNDGFIAKKWLGLLNVIEPITTKGPFMPVNGNHDVDTIKIESKYQRPSSAFRELFDLPNGGENFSFSYANTHFIGINSGLAKKEEKSGDVLFAKDSPEYKWLERDLAKAKKDRNITWIIIYMHYPLYSYGWSHVLPWQERITPLLDKYKVDLALAGHRHTYERHKAIFNNNILTQEEKNSYNQPKGTVYITNGSAGGTPQGLGGHNMPSMVFTSAEKMYNYALMTIEGNKLSYTVYNKDNEIIDFFNISK